MKNMKNIDLKFTEYIMNYLIIQLRGQVSEQAI
jgi:hypothetical protein